MIRSAVLRRVRAGAAIRYAGIDLDGFEPSGQDASDFAKYLRHLAAKYGPEDSGRWREFAKWVGEINVKLTLGSAALAAVALDYRCL